MQRAELWAVLVDEPEPADTQAELPTDVLYRVQWVGDPGVEPFGGDNIEAALRASRVQELREQRAEEERQTELQDRAEMLARNAPTFESAMNERLEQIRRSADCKAAAAADRHDEDGRLVSGSGPQDGPPLWGSRYDPEFTGSADERVRHSGRPERAWAQRAKYQHKAVP